MHKKIFGFLAGIVLVLLLCSGIFADIMKFFTWLFTLEYITPDTSIAGSIIVKMLTFAVSYTLVGIIFNSLGLFNSKVMSFVYLIISIYKYIPKMKNTYFEYIFFIMLETFQPEQIYTRYLRKENNFC